MKALRFWKQVTSWRDFWPVVVVLIFAFLAARHLFTPGYFNMHDDLQLMRQLELEKCFLDGQVPCRWVPDMGYGYGFPLFNFYPPLPYLFGQIIRLIGFSFIDTAKLLFATAFIASGLTMYFFAKRFFGKLGGIVAAVFYIWAPYHSVDIFVRGAMNESWALIFFPAILLSSYNLISSKTKKHVYLILLALSWFGLLTSHNLMVLIFTPIFIVWCLFWLITQKNLRNIIYLAVSGILAFGLAAFFTLPVFLEQKLVHADTLVQGYYEYTAHFATISQLLFSRFWGYGPSVWMDADDKMSFQIGQVHWIASLVAIVVVILTIYKTKLKDKKTNYLLLATSFFIGIGWFTAFMIHSKSIFIWKSVEQLAYVQFPWRFLTLVIFSFSFVAGSLAYLLKSRVLKVVLISSCIFLVFYNWDYFKPEHGHTGPLSEEEKFSGAAWDLQRTAGIFDYLPKTAKENPKDPPIGIAEVVDGEAEILNPDQGSNWSTFDVEVFSENSRVRINIYQFPNWKVFVDGEEIETIIPEEEKWGRIHVFIPQGQHEVYIKLFDTPVRSLGNIISLVSWVGLVAFVVINRKNYFK